MSTWLIILIVVGVVLLLASLGYVIYRFGSKKVAITRAILAISGSVFDFLTTIFKDNPEKLDVHDFMKASSEIAKACLTILDKYGANMFLNDAKEEMKFSVRCVVDSFPGLGENITDEVIDKIVDTVFVAAGHASVMKAIVKK